MGLSFFFWNKLFVNDKYKRKRYEYNSIYNQDRSIKTLAFMAASQVKAGIVGKNSEKSDDLYTNFTYDVNKIYSLIDENDVISFDVFDTLIFRPVSKPTDLFWFLEMKNGIFDFKKLRITAEIQARKETEKPNNEISLVDIYNQFDKLHICSIDQMVQDEEDLEYSLAYGNEFAIDLYNYAKKRNKKIIAISDMYLSSDLIRRILNKNGIEIEDIYVSSEIGINKMDSSLQKYVLHKYSDSKILHIGDNKAFDIKASKKVGFNTLYIENVNYLGHKKRAFVDDSFEGSIYSGIVNSKLYNGCFGTKSPQYMYGFLYGGLVTQAFCQWLNKYVKDIQADHIIFLGRDCKIIKQVYELNYENNSSYMEISRFAILPLLATISYENFLLEGFERRINDGYKFSDVFKKVGLNICLNDIFEDKLKDEEILCRNNYETFKHIMYKNRQIILKAYKERINILEEYIDSFIRGKKRVIIVDLGWRASTIIFLKEYLKYKKINIDIYGAVFGLCDSDTTSVFDSMGVVRSFLFSSHNNETMTVNNDEFCFTDSRFMLEFMYSSLDNSVIGYCKNNNQIEIIRENRDIALNNKYISDMHEGINDFALTYNKIMQGYKDKIVFSPELSIKLLRNCMRKYNIKKLFPNFNESNGTVHGY